MVSGKPVLQNRTVEVYMPTWTQFIHFIILTPYQHMVRYVLTDQGAETSCVCVCTKRVCVSNTKPKACTVGIYST